MSGYWFQGLRSEGLTTVGVDYKSVSFWYQGLPLSDIGSGTGIPSIQVNLIGVEATGVAANLSTNIIIANVAILLEGVSANGEVGFFPQAATIYLVGVVAHCLAEPIQFPKQPLPIPLIPSYLYQEYNDDDDLQAFVKAYNEYARDFIRWFGGLNLPIYTTDPISGALLDWVGEGLYGMARPKLTSGNIKRIGPFNTYAFNTWPLNTIKDVTVDDAFVVTNDNIYRRILTWHIQKSMGEQFNIKWLKRRIMQVMFGANGVVYNVDNTYPISIQFGPEPNTVNINFIHGISRVVAGAYFNRNSFNTMSFNRLIVDFTPIPIPDHANVLKAAIASGVLELPFQYKFVVNL